jgi:hypothetical protein
MKFSNNLGDEGLKGSAQVLKDVENKGKADLVASPNLVAVF